MRATATPGQRFGRLVVLRLAGKTKWNETIVSCKCDCGLTVEKIYKLLTRGDTRSCGCLSVAERKSRAIHRKCGSPAYFVWHNMICRCENKNVQSYKDYGARGIRVCDEWKTFKGFYDDMGDPPPGMTIERIDNNGPYCKANCKWATRLEQGKNRRNNRMLSLNGETHHMAEWSRITGLPNSKIKKRLSYGWSVERALCEP